MARDNLPILILALGGAVGLWLWSRTRYGEDVTSDIVGTIFDSVDTSTDVAAQAVRDAMVDIPNLATTATQAVIDYTMPRGIRNNNPGNIDRALGVSWVGMSADQSGDPRFIVFSAPEYGIRAMARVLRNYASRGITTVGQIISTWAPAVENKTVEYINSVSSALGIPPNVPVPQDRIPGLIAAIIQHENGRQPYGADVIARGIALERST